MLLCTLPASALYYSAVRHWAFTLVLEKSQQEELGFYLRPRTKNPAALENIQSSILMVHFASENTLSCFVEN